MQAVPAYKPRHGEPRGGKWFGLQKHMHEYVQMCPVEEHDSLVTVAWHKKKGGGYSFGVYPDAATLHAALLQLPVNKRFLFEQIQKNKGCRAYGDVEWVGAADKGHTRMREFCKRLRGWCRDKHGLRAELYVNTSSCATREPGVYKHSYHVVISNLIFASNHSGAMQQFWRDFTACELNTAEWWWTKRDKKGEEWRVHILDGSVYTSWRNFRFSLCSKQGGERFERISGLPTDEDDDLSATFDDSDPAAFVPFLVGNAQAAEGCVLVPEHAPLRREERVRAAPDSPREHKRARREGSGDASEAIPACVRGDILVQGESVVKFEPLKDRPGAVTTQISEGYVKEEDVKYLYIVHPKICATKLFVHGKVHKHPSNNSMCVVVPPYEEYPHWQVYVKCHCDEYKTPRTKLSVVHEKLKELPRYEKFAQRVVETTHGLYAVDDAEFRRQVKHWYTSHKTGKLSFLNKKWNRVLWEMYLKSYDQSWFLLPVRCDPSASCGNALWPKTQNQCATDGRARACANTMPSDV